MLTVSIKLGMGCWIVDINKYIQLFGNLFPILKIRNYFFNYFVA